MAKILFVDNNDNLAQNSAEPIGQTNAPPNAFAGSFMEFVISQTTTAPVTPADGIKYLDEGHELEGIILGQTIPETDALYLLKTLRAKYKKSETFAIAVVHSGDVQLPMKYIEAGASDFIRAPFSQEELWFRIAQNKALLPRYNGASSINTDYLTQLVNRRYFYRMAEKLFASYERGHIHLTCAMIDIDNFVFLNDVYGERTGDLIIQHVANILKNRFRKTDLLTRYGGKKFCILNVNLERDSAFSVFDELRHKIEESPLRNLGDILKLTISIGVYTGETNHLEDMIRKAAVLLQTAKKQGNRVMVE